MDETSILRACPFCGQAPSTPSEIDDHLWAVVCSHCHAIGPQAEDAAGASQAWNNRPAPRIST